jgi:hypothetical protein
MGDTVGETAGDSERHSGRDTVGGHGEGDTVRHAVWETEDTGRHREGDAVGDSEGETETVGEGTERETHLVDEFERLLRRRIAEALRGAVVAPAAQVAVQHLGERARHGAQPGHLHLPPGAPVCRGLSAQRVL